MISASQIIKHHCDRSSVLADKFKLNSSTFYYPVLLGNIIHEAFERIMIAENNFDSKFLDTIFKESIKRHYCFLRLVNQPEFKIL